MTSTQYWKLSFFCFAAFLVFTCAALCMTYGWVGFMYFLSGFFGCSFMAFAITASQQDKKEKEDSKRRLTGG